MYSLIPVHHKPKKVASATYCKDWRGKKVRKLSLHGKRDRYCPLFRFLLSGGFAYLLPGSSGLCMLVLFSIFAGLVVLITGVSLFFAAFASLFGFAELFIL